MTVFALGLYAPLVLVAFAQLAMLLTAYAMPKTEQRFGSAWPARLH